MCNIIHYINAPLNVQHSPTFWLSLVLESVSVVTQCEKCEWYAAGHWTRLHGLFLEWTSQRRPVFREVIWVSFDIFRYLPIMLLIHQASPAVISLRLELQLTFSSDRNSWLNSENYDEFHHPCKFMISACYLACADNQFNKFNTFDN